LFILSILEEFDSTRWITILLRTAGTGAAVEEAERQEAFSHVRGLWNRAAALVRSNNRPPNQA
jgi:hypothetical protein